MIYLILGFTICLTIVQPAVIDSLPLESSRLLQQQSTQTMNLLRFDSPNTLTSTACLNWNGLSCTQCRQGFTLTNGKCYQTIANCLIQYTNICSSCQPNFRPATSLQTPTGQPSTLTVTCIPVSTPLINSTTNNSTNIPNPLISLGRQQFITWTNIEIRYPTDVYLVMIWNFLDGNNDLRVGINIKESVLTSAVRGRIRNLTDKVTVTNWVVQNQMVNFLDGHLIDIQNIFFYRLRYRVRATQTDYEVLAMIHEVNFQITLLQHLLVPSVNNTVGNGPILNSNLSESQQVKAMRQQILDLKMQASQQRQLYKQRQLLLLLFSQYSILSPLAVQRDPGCTVIKAYLDNKFSDFLKLLNISATPNPGIYAWMNMQVSRVYVRKSDSVNREYLYEIGFTDDIVVMVVFELGRLYQMLDVKVVYNK